jgi:hypothetical protein
MTAPTKPGTREPRARTTTRAPQQKPPAPKPPQHTNRENASPARSRSAAAERAYQRRAQRAGNAQRAGKVIGAVGQKVAAAPVSTRSPRAPFVVLVMGLLVAGVAATLWLSTQATADSYRLEQAKQGANSLSERVEQLQAEVATQQSPGALAQKARDLGMVPAGDPAHLVVGDDGKVRLVGDPEPAQAPDPPPPPPAPAPPAPDQQQDQQQDQQPGRSDDGNPRTAPQDERQAAPPSGQQGADPPDQQAAAAPRQAVAAERANQGNTARASGGE